MADNFTSHTISQQDEVRKKLKTSPAAPDSESNRSEVAVAASVAPPRQQQSYLLTLKKKNEDAARASLASLAPAQALKEIGLNGANPIHEEAKNDHNDSDTESIGSQNDSGQTQIDFEEHINNFYSNFIDHDKTAILWTIQGNHILQSLNKVLIDCENKLLKQSDILPLSDKLQVHFKLPDGFSITIKMQARLSDKTLFISFHNFAQEREMSLSLDLKSSIAGKTIKNILGSRTLKKDDSENVVFESIGERGEAFPLASLSNEILVISGGIRQRTSSKESCPYNGLRNQGNTCYMNSYLQTLYHISEFTRLILRIPSQANPHKLPDSLQILSCGLCQETTPQTTLDLIKSFGWDRSEAFQQQDVQEFGCNIIEALEAKVDSHPNLKGEVQRLFQGQFKNIIACKNVNYKSETSESFQDIQLQVKDMKDVVESLRQFTSSELLEGDNQYETGEVQFGKQDAVKCSRLSKLPPILQITLKRFGYDPEKDRLVKILDQYEYPEEIHLAEFMEESVRREKPDSEFDYRLQAVLVHSGLNNGSGHYYVFIRKRGGWYKFNDSFVEQVSWEQVRLSGIGGIISSPVWNDRVEQYNEQKRETAYMLVYVQQNQFEQITSDLSERDIPHHILTYHQNMKIKKKIQEREKNFMKVRMFDFEGISKTKGNGLFFQQEFINSDIQLCDLAQFGLNVEVSNSMTIAELQTRLADAQESPTAPTSIVIYKITLSEYQNNERIINLSRLLNFKSTSKFLVKDLLAGKGSQAQSCLLVLSTDQKTTKITFPDCFEPIPSSDLPAAVSPAKDDTRMVSEQYFDGIAVFFKEMLNSSKGSKVQQEIQLRMMQNSLIGYSFARIENSIYEAILVFADINEVQIEALLKNYSLYAEKDRKVEKIFDFESKQSLYSTWKSSFYAVVVLESITDSSYQKSIVEEYYQYHSSHMSIEFEEHSPISPDTPRKSATLLISSDYSVESLQFMMKETFYEDVENLKIENIYFLEESDGEWVEFDGFESVSEVMSKVSKVRFAYDPNISISERKELSSFDFFIQDQTSSDIVSKPQEKRMKFSKNITYQGVIDLLEENPSLIDIQEKDSLKNQIVIGRTIPNNVHRIYPNNVMSFLILNHHARKKFITVLERQYYPVIDYLIACQFVSPDGQTFGYPFIVVEQKDTSIGQLSKKMNERLKNKRISKFQNSDATYVLSKFEMGLSSGAKPGSDGKRFIPLEENSEQSIESSISDFYQLNDMLVIQITVNGIDLQTALKKIN